MKFKKSEAVQKAKFVLNFLFSYNFRSLFLIKVMESLQSFKASITSEVKQNEVNYS